MTNPLQALRTRFKTPGSPGTPVASTDFTVQEPLVNVQAPSLADRLAPAALVVGKDASQFSETEWIRTYYVRSWPEYLATSAFQKILKFAGDVRISMFLNPLPGHAVARQLEQQIAARSAEKHLRHFQKRDQSAVIDREMEELQKAQWDVAIEGEPFYEFTLVLSVQGSSEADLGFWCRKLEDLFRTLNVTLDRAMLQQLKGLTAMQPLANNTFGSHSRNMPLGALTQMWPFAGTEVMQPDGLYLGHALSTHMTMCVAPSRQDNRNVIILGPSGGGKSVWMKDDITQRVTRGQRVYVLDVDGEYDLLAQDLGGQTVDMGLKSAHKINVLAPDPQDDLAPEDRTGLAGAYQDFREWLTTAIGRTLVASEVPVLERCYKEVMADRGIHAEDPQSLHRRAPVLAHLVTRLEQDPSPYAINLVDELHPMARGFEREAFNCETNLDIRGAPLVVFGLKSVPRTMMAKRMRQVLTFVTQQMLNNAGLIQTQIYIDEGWAILQHEHMVRDLAEWSVRGRKRNFGVTIGTQHCNHFARSAHAEVILENAATRLLFRQEASAVAQLAGLFHLEPGEARALMRMKKGEYLLLSHQLKVTCYKPVPPGRLRLYSTTPEQVLAFRKDQAARAADPTDPLASGGEG